MAESFVFYRSFHKALSHLDGDLYKETMEAICNYALDGVNPDCSGIPAMVFELIKPQIDANIRRRENGKRGGRPKKEEPDHIQNEATKEPRDNREITEKKPKNNQDKTKAKPNVNDNDNDNVNDNVINLSILNNKDSYNNNITPPTPPEGGTVGEWDYSAHSNLENTKHILSSGVYGETEYIKANGLWNIIRDWMEYKDARKPKQKNHYVTERSIKSILTEIVNNCKMYGKDATVKTIEHSMGQTYVGIIWDKIDSYKNQNTPRGNPQNNNPWKNGTASDDQEAEYLQMLGIGERR